MRTTFAIFIVSFIALASSCVYSPPKEPVDYVNPNIGTIGHLLVATASMVQLPHGMVQIGQNPYPPLADRYLADRISGFSVRALPKYTTKPFSWIMATTGAPRINPNDYASGFDHDFEKVTPYYSWILLEDYDIEAAMTVTQHSSFYKFKYPKSSESNILMNNNQCVRVVGNNCIESVEAVDSTQTAYYYAIFSKPFRSYVTWKDSLISQSVALTLENCYDDWCMSILAKELGKEDDYQYYLNRAYNYRNVFDTKSGFMRPKTADGKWIEPFDPIWSGGQGGRDFYTENNGWNYTWYVLHDPQGLINLMGGQEPFVAKLQQMFETNVPLYKKYDFLKQYPDMTGWIGMYSHGNEITWHIPYLYNYAGKPWMTQRRIRQILDLWYGDGPLGFCGDEDYGEMSSWYILSAMGFYTVAPGRPVYDIGSPLFEKSTIDIGDGKKFTIECRNISAQNKYIQSASMNGKELNRAWFTHEELMQGGTLLLNMGPRPNKKWATDIENLPVSLTPISSK